METPIPNATTTMANTKESRRHKKNHKPRVAIICTTCSKEGHFASLCPERICSKCNKKGHDS